MRHNEENAENLPRPSLRQPAFDPCKYHLQEQQIECRKRDQHEQRPRKQERRATVIPEQNSVQPTGWPSAAGGIEQPYATRTKKYDR